MTHSKNLLVLQLHHPATMEDVSNLKAILAPVAERLGSEYFIAPEGTTVEHHTQGLVEAITRQCEAIENLVSVNQAILEYMMQLDSGESAPAASGTLD